MITTTQNKTLLALAQKEYFEQISSLAYRMENAETQEEFKAISNALLGVSRVLAYKAKSKKSFQELIRTEN